MKRVLSLMLVASGALLGASAMPSYAADAAARPKADLAKGEELFTNGDEARGIISCASCHGPGGNSSIPINPILAKQHPEYLIKQLHDFKTGDEGKAAARPSASMAVMAEPLTEEDIRNIAAYLGKQAVEEPAYAKNPATIEQGQTIYRAGITAKGVPACAACHSPNGAGIPAQYPRLAGQFPDYTEQQLIEFRSGERQNHAAMAAIAAKLSDAEIKAVSDYIAGLR